MDNFEKTIKDIKDLKIQGARSIALMGIKALKEEQMKISSKNKKEYSKKVFELAKKLAGTRPTEPALRNSLTFVLFQLANSRIEDIEFLKKFVNVKCEEVEKDLENAHERASEMASRRIPERATIFTHCHSTTVTMSIKKAWDQKKKINVICTETRPRFQGYITAKELSEYGIPTTLIVDSACRVFLRESDIVMIGADVITSTGAVINKIGSSVVASIAKELRKPLIVVSGSYKFDPLTIVGYLEAVEERDSKEVVDPKLFPKVKIRNPAFDVIAPDHIDSIITELGVSSPSEVYNIFIQKYKWVEKGQKILKSLVGW